MSGHMDCSYQHQQGHAERAICFGPQGKDVQSGEMMAVKVYNLNALGELNKVQLIREIRLHGGFAHRNIIELYAAFQVSTARYKPSSLDMQLPVILHVRHEDCANPSTGPLLTPNNLLPAWMM